ncbi:hypothetical protein SAMN05421504_102689 [Amycolatopsis xylanica]|uniref:Uncharacterized protein n=1 Tax=Amycolatopsis xylanica TaxID=589385 RepID=A0A1H2ZVD5_9PSEU|nr:hypothetical protein [Amycolatopsis xylanica]SDX21560.1 hypothetical protein SAMN05421504_102689 [Amycolatopsis xylanica]
MDRDLKALLDTAVRVEPWLRIDAAAVLAEGSALRSRGRRLLTMGGAALSVIAVAVSAVLVATRAPEQVVAQSPRERQLSEAFRLADHLPSGVAASGQDRFVRSDNAYELHAKLTDQLGTAILDIGVTLPTPWTASCEQYHRAYRCETILLPDGSHLVAYQSDDEFLVVRRVGDHIVSVRLSTRAVDGVVTRPRPPLSIDRLIGIASSPALSQ